MELVNATKADMPLVKQLYKDAFPAIERKPFFMIENQVQAGKMEILVVKDPGFLGFAITMVGEKLILLDYFAVSSLRRGGGIGGKTIELLKQRYADKCIVIEIELEDAKAKNNDERIRRKQFYLRNGYIETDIKAVLFGVDMEIMTNGCDVTFEEYLNLVGSVIGEGRAKRNIRRIELN